MPDLNDGSLTDNQLDGIAAGLAEQAAPGATATQAKPTTSRRAASRGTMLTLHWRGKAPRPCEVSAAIVDPPEIAAGVRQTVDVRIIRDDGKPDPMTVHTGVAVFDRLGDAEREALASLEPDLVAWAEHVD